MPLARARYYFVFLLVMLTIGANVGQHLLEALNVSRNYLLLTLVAVTIAGLLAHRNMFFILLVGGLTVAVNLPADLLVMNQINPQMLFATLLAVILLPVGIKLWDTVA